MERTEVPNCTIPLRLGCINRIFSNDYVSIARPDHWFKNIFVIPGIVFSWMAVPPQHIDQAIVSIAWTLIAVCLVCSANYTINELLDAPEDRKHPVKRFRPAACGRIKTHFAYLQWFILGASGLVITYVIDLHLLIANATLLVMGLIYNVRPFRSKDLPYLDVLSESVNNPLRFLLGWYAFGSTVVPPVSLILAYWMLGAFFMAIKRFAEIRQIKDIQVLASYRKSFSHYTSERLLISILVYSSAFAFFSGIFIIRYHVELVLLVPLYSLFMGIYLRLGFKENSPVQNPESLYKNKMLVLFCIVVLLATVGCLSIYMPFMHRLFETTIPNGF